jgi:hypothetical protein
MSYHLLQIKELQQRLRALVEDEHPTWLTWHLLDGLLPRVRLALASLTVERNTLLAIGHPEGPELQARIADVIRLHNLGTVALDMGEKHPAITP